MLVISAAAVFFVVLLSLIVTARTFHTQPWDRDVLHRAILTELSLHPEQSIWNPENLDVDEFCDSLSTIHLRHAIETATDGEWLRKYRLFFSGRRRMLRELGGFNDPIAREARRLRHHDDSLRLSKRGDRWVVTKLPSGMPLGTVARLSVFYHLRDGDVWRRTFVGKPGRRVYRLDYYPHLLLEDIRSGAFPGEHIQDFP